MLCRALPGSLPVTGWFWYSAIHSGISSSMFWIVSRQASMVYIPPTLSPKSFDNVSTFFAARKLTYLSASAPSFVATADIEKLLTTASRSRRLFVPNFSVTLTCLLVNRTLSSRHLFSHPRHVIKELLLLTCCCLPLTSFLLSLVDSRTYDVFSRFQP